ncbi:MAG: alpha/beta fold hydrolase [Deltaproteobacteria bacterium]|nr:MAG: alpha/beta fold hydrolase [Deltaproteobacteria bacterium]
MLRRVLVAATMLAVVWLLVRSAPSPPPSSTVVGAMGRGPTIVLVHGLGSDATDWLPVARDLARDHRVVLCELPGHGVAPLAKPFALEQAMLALDRAIAEQSREPVVLVGHSVGGLVAASEALHSPSRVRGLVLVETALAPQLAPAEAETLLAQLDRDWEGTLHAVYSSFGRDSLQGEMLWAKASQVERATMRAWIPVAIATDLSGEAASLAMPVLAVLAPRSWEADETWEHAAQALGYAHVPRVRGVRIENCGHFVMLDRPKRLADVVRRFSTNVDSAYALR